MYRKWIQEVYFYYHQMSLFSPPLMVYREALIPIRPSLPISGSCLYNSCLFSSCDFRYPCSSFALWFSMKRLSSYATRVYSMYVISRASILSWSLDLLTLLFTSLYNLHWWFCLLPYHLIPSILHRQKLITTCTLLVTVSHLYSITDLTSELNISSLGPSNSCVCTLSVWDNSRRPGTTCRGQSMVIVSFSSYNILKTHICTALYEVLLA